MATASLLSGCFTDAKNLSSYKELTQNSSVSEKAVEIFLKGETELSCGIKCAGDWGYNKATILSHWKNEQYSELAKNIIAVNHGVDVNYFLLGQAAEGMEYPEVAKIYYRKSIDFSYKCDGFVNNCDGINVPEEAEAALNRLNN